MSTFKFGQTVICISAPWHNLFMLYAPHNVFHGGFGPRVNELVTIGETNVHPDRNMIEILEYRHCACGKVVCFDSRNFTLVMQDEQLTNELNLILP